MAKVFHPFLILLILVLITAEDKIYELKEVAEFQTNTKDAEIVRLFSLKEIPTTVKTKEWYAFLELQIPEKNFADKVYVELSTVSIATRVESERKVKCESLGEHLSDCFIGSNQINPDNEYLSVKLDLMATLSGKMYIEIDEVKSLKVNQGYLLQKGVSSFSRILRLDTRSFPSKFNYLVCEMKALNQEPDYNELFYFLMSKEEAPPNHFRYSQISTSLWANNHQGGFTFFELQQTQFLTLTVQIIGSALYEMKCSTVGGGAGRNQTLELQINKSYHQLYVPGKVYHLKLPQQRKPNTYYLVGLETQQLGQLSFKYVKLNKKAVSVDDLKRMNNQSNFFSNDIQMQLWLNQTYRQVEFQIKLVNHLLFTISVEKYNLNLIQLREGRAWLDTLQVNQTEHLFFTLNSKNVKDSVSFDVQLMTLNKEQTSELDLKFYYCSQKTIQLCQQSVYTNDTVIRKTALPIIRPKVTNYPLHKKFSFLNLYVTMYQIREKVYQSIIVIEISARKKELYSLSWHPIQPLQVLRQNKIVRGHLDEGATQTYYFFALNITKIHFARIDFLFEGIAQIFVSTELLDLQTEILFDFKDQQNYYRFQNSITIPNIISMKKYYIYLLGTVRGNYRLRLSYGYNYDDNNQHPISYLTAGEHYKSEVTLQPSQIVFIEVRSTKNLYLTIQNSVTLKFCYLTATSMPTSHKDVISSTYCTDFKTQNSFFVGSFNTTGKSYIALQNQQTVPVLTKLTTETQNFRCLPIQMGEKQIVNQFWQTRGGCFTYQITHKGEIQVSTDLSNPKMQGMKHPVISIHKDFKFKMTSNLKIIRAPEIDLACEGQYDECFLNMAFEPVKQTNVSLDSFSIFVSYTDRPLLLSDGIGHPTQLEKGEVKHFKYALTLAKSIMVMIKQNEYLDEYTIYAKLVTINQKFTYPNSQEYHRYLNTKDRGNLSEVYISKTNWLVGTPNMKIGQNKINNYCKDQFTFQCYLLISVQSTQFLKGQFTIQVTQTVHTIKLGYAQDAYLSKGDFDYFSFYNNRPNSSVLFLISSHASICHKLAVYEGNTDITKAISLDHYSEVLLQKTKQGWYTIIVQATDDCFYSIQASSSEKQIAELNFGFAAPFALKNGEKRYFLLRNHNLDKIKIIGGIDRNMTGEVILRGIPVTDKEVPDFMHFIDGQAEIGKKNKLEYAWAHKNHLVIRSSDAKFCKDCFVCLEVEAVGDASGFLAVSSNNLQNVQMNTESVMYDILLKGETFTWIFRYINLQGLIDINLQAGGIKVQFFQNDTKLLQKNEIKYDKFNPNNSKITFKVSKSFAVSYLSIKVTAIENADYSVIHYSTKNGKKPSEADIIEVGRPKNILFVNNNSYCIKGKANYDPTEFVLILKDDHFVKAIKDTDEEAKLVAGKLVVDATANQKTEKMKIERVKHNFLITFENPLAIINQTYNICFNVRNDTTQHRATLILLGNLNYFSQNEPLYIRKEANLTFMSDGRGLIQIDQCSSRANLVLSTKYDGLTKSTSNLNHRRVINNYITFTYVGPIYLGVQTEDFVTLRWKNYHTNSLNGYAYDYFSVSTFRLHQSKTLEQLSLTIKPLIVDQQDKPAIPQILQIVYDIYIAKQQSDLYNGMNCERGNFMHFSRRITTKEQYIKELQVHLNNRQDVRKTFRQNDYVLITVKASLDVKWKNNVVENYRFYYPYQQLMLQQRKSIIKDQKIEQKTIDVQNESTTVYIVVIAVLLFILVGILVAVLVIYVRRKYRAPRLIQEDLPNVSSGFDYKQPTELVERSQNKI